jgi:hypothetical protein
MGRGFREHGDFVGFTTTRCLNRGYPGEYAHGICPCMNSQYAGMLESSFCSERDAFSHHYHYVDILYDCVCAHLQAKSETCVLLRRLLFFFRHSQQDQERLSRFVHSLESIISNIISSILSYVVRIVHSPLHSRILVFSAFGCSCMYVCV